MDKIFKKIKTKILPHSLAEVGERRLLPRGLFLKNNYSVKICFISK
jgi:hypothetical protein